MKSRDERRTDRGGRRADLCWRRGQEKLSFGNALFSRDCRHYPVQGRHCLLHFRCLTLTHIIPTGLLFVNIPFEPGSMLGAEMSSTARITRRSARALMLSCMCTGRWPEKRKRAEVRVFAWPQAQMSQGRFLGRQRKRKEFARKESYVNSGSTAD